MVPAAPLPSRCPYWDANQSYFRDVWGNVMPVSWTQLADFGQRGLVGPDL